MKTKRMIAMALTGITAGGLLAGCGSNNNTSNTGSVSNTSASQTTQSTAQSISEATDTEDVDTGDVISTEEYAQETESTAAEGGKTLVVYYSASGNTKDVAETIAEAAGADLFEVVPTEPYTDEDLNWTNDDSRVTKEHEDESLRDVELTTTEVPDWDSYDTVFIGYPIWWGIAAWPLDGFVKANDFTGKTVIPFCTSASSGIGDSGNLLEEMAGTGDWQEGQRFRSGASAADVQAWVEELGLAK